MRLLFTVVHFFKGGAKGLRPYGSMGQSAATRARALTECLSSLHSLFGQEQFNLDHGRRAAFPANTALRHTVDVVVCTVKDMHVLSEVQAPVGAYEHRLTEADPKLLGYECHAVLQERLGSYDYYCYLEDDLILHDPLFFTKLNWFNQLATPQDLLQPNRYEVAFNGSVNKVYIDGELPPRSTAPFQKVEERNRLKAVAMGQDFFFRRTLNPHSGAFFLSEKQMRLWAEKPYFLDRSALFIGPPESAATLGIMKTFRVYKPGLRNAGFLELQHGGTSYLELIGRKVPIAGTEPAKKAVSAAQVTTTPKAAAKAQPPAVNDPGASVDAAVEEGLRQFDF